MELSKKQVWLVVFLVTVSSVAFGVSFTFILKSRHIIPIFRNTVLFFWAYLVFVSLFVIGVFYYLLSHLMKQVRSREERIELINRLYRTLSKINRLVIVADSKKELLQDACEVFVEEGGFELAWGAIVENEEIKEVSCKGIEDTDEITRVLVSLIQTRGKDFFEKLKLGEIILFESLDDGDNISWLDGILRFGFKSCACIPILIGKELVALMGIYSRKPLLINDPEEMRLLKEIQSDLSFAFSMITKLEFEKLLLKAFDQTNEVIIITDRDGNVIYANPAIEQVSGFKAHELLDRKPVLLDLENFPEGEREILKGKIESKEPFSWITVNRKKSGEVVQLEQIVTPIKDKSGNVTNYVITARDITGEEHLREKLKEVLYKDPVTNLPNRLYLEEKLHTAVENARKKGEKVALFYLDIWGFSEINSTYGFNSGDKVLTMVGERLKGVVGEINSVVRLGGDEFGVLIESLKNIDEVRFWLDQITGVFRNPLRLGENEIHLDINIGIAVFPDGTNSTELISQADAALKNAKEEGPGTYKFFTEEITIKMQRKIFMDNRLKEASRNKNFMLYYQPVIDLQSGFILGFEALMRWHDSKLGWVPPDEFIPEMETLGLIVEVGNWVLDTSWTDLREFLDIKNDLKVAVNLSPVQLRREIFFDNIIARLKKSDLSPEHFAFEITESDIMTNIEKINEFLKILREMGVQIDIDDFGTGYSSLAYLKKLPIDHIKIDKSFVMDTPGDREDVVIVKAITTMAHELGLEIIAEGVETVEQVKFLKQLGVEHGQGYYFSKPIPRDEALELLVENLRTPFEV